MLTPGAARFGRPREEAITAERGVEVSGIEAMLGDVGLPLGFIVENRRMFL